MLSSNRYDFIVVGMGIAGASVLYQLAKRGVRVLGIDQYEPPHALGSSHGKSRLTRQAIGEGEEYLPLIRKSRQVWKELGELTGENVLDEMGMLIVSSKEQSTFSHTTDFYQRTVDTAIKSGVSHELLTSTEVRERFPQYNLSDNEYAYYEHEAGIVRPETAIRTQLSLAKKMGAKVKMNTQMLSYNSESGEVSVSTSQGIYNGNQLVLALGPWFPRDIRETLKPLVKVYRQTLFWFGARESLKQFESPHFPLFIWELEGFDSAFYGFPSEDGAGVKLATEQYLGTTRPEIMDRNVSQEEKDWIYENFVQHKFPGLSHTCLEAKACLYSVTADFGFILDHLPGEEKVYMVSACSGHGFKHAAGIGEVVAKELLGEDPEVDQSPFRLDRLLKA